MNTTDEIAAAEKEVSANYEYFKQMQPEWRGEHLLEFALIHRQQLVDFFESENDAVKVGIKDYGMGKFSVQSVKDDPIDLGYQSHALF
ncbi:MAG: hypothetical protein OXU71_01170 [Gammaproteobacteria bacterium]|nr:hypothetical protein [Gammaproteobacteria bacterium]